MGKTLTFLFMMGTLQGCTVLGFAGDIALLAVAGDPNKGLSYHDPRRINTAPLTNLGFKQDVKVIKTVLNDIAKHKAETAPIVDDGPLFPANYTNKHVCEQTHSLVTECYGPEYYQTFYEQAQSNSGSANSDEAEPELELQEN
jgi:hypothetical protein